MTDEKPDGLADSGTADLEERVRALNGELVFQLVEKRLQDSPQEKGGWKEPTKVLAVATLMVGLLQFGVAEFDHWLASRLENQRKV